MRIISFAHTTPALVARRKTVTRRDWDDEYAERFQADELVQAYNRSPWRGIYRESLAKGDKHRALYASWVLQCVLKSSTLPKEWEESQ